eukprot:TRINITY_DN3389_c0_g1_i1.p1 TRINITY_DN3389_c0_g1~~TRINITY_DN3389_c0_g1_i1.p1  ORF type:complete len:245 (-),score=40.86 TRINITY_DN3389_c0_g1_i1:1114-1848(-)
MSTTQNLTCNDGILFLALGYSIVTLCIKWTDYSKCHYPLQLFLIVNYASILVFRGVSFVQYCCRNSAMVVKVLAIVKIFGIYTFFIVWTVIGTVWFALDHVCLPEENQYATFIIWFVLCYLGIVGYMVFVCLVYHLGLVGAVFLSPGGFDPADMAENPLLQYQHVDQGLSDAEIERIPVSEISRTEAGLKNSCAICLEHFEEGQLVKLLNPCQHKFHVDHIDEWLARKPTCPVCRADVQVPAEV